MAGRRGLKEDKGETVKKLCGRQLEGQMADWAITFALLLIKVANGRNLDCDHVLTSPN